MHFEWYQYVAAWSCAIVTLIWLGIALGKIIRLFERVAQPPSNDILVQQMFAEVHNDPTIPVGDHGPRAEARREFRRR
jgi:hypothetical protein